MCKIILLMLLLVPTLLQSMEPGDPDQKRGPRRYPRVNERSIPPEVLAALRAAHAQEAQVESPTGENSNKK